MSSALSCAVVALLCAPCLVFAAEDPPTLAQRYFGREVTLGAGMLGAGYGFEGGSMGDLFTTQQVEARWLFSGFTLEGSLLDALPVVSRSNGQSITAMVRVGWTGERFSGALGAVTQYVPTARPSNQLLPTARVAYAFDRFALSAGLFDLHALAIARVSVDVDNWGAGYIAPLGLEAHARIPIAHEFGLRVQALAFKAGPAQVGFVAVSGSFMPGGEG